MCHIKCVISNRSYQMSVISNALMRTRFVASMMSPLGVVSMIRMSRGSVVVDVVAANWKDMKKLFNQNRDEDKSLFCNFISLQWFRIKQDTNLIEKEEVCTFIKVLLPTHQIVLLIWIGLFGIDQNIGNLVLSCILFRKKWQTRELYLMFCRFVLDRSGFRKNLNKGKL